MATYGIFTFKIAENLYLEKILNCTKWFWHRTYTLTAWALTCWERWPGGRENRGRQCCLKQLDSLWPSTRGHWPLTQRNLGKCCILWCWGCNLQLWLTAGPILRIASCNFSKKLQCVPNPIYLAVMADTIMTHLTRSSDADYPLFMAVLVTSY